MQSPLAPSWRDAVDLWVAQGLGVGRIPWAPGTFGSALGLGWFLLLSAVGSIGLFLAGIALGVGVSVWIGGRAERLLGRKDPGCVVIDEIAALPCCYLAPVLLHARQNGSVPPAGAWFDGHAWMFLAFVFCLFRIFDIWKPWPVRQSQSLPGGWGLTVDDLLAAVYVNLVAMGLLWAWSG
jgi:phosphatidylglycerophosphatase A